MKKQAKGKSKIKAIEICAKCSDLFSMGVHANGKTNWTYGGYVPGFFPGEHWGDYVNLVIDVNTGKILNWKKPNQETLKKLLEEKEEKQEIKYLEEVPF